MLTSTRGRRGVRRVVTWVATVLAVLLVLLALLLPNDLVGFTPAAFLRIPLEALLGAVLLVALPPRARRVVALILGVALGLLVILKILDMGFLAVSARPFDPLIDWSLFSDGVGFLSGAMGQVGAIVSVVAAALVIVAMVALVTLSVVHLSRLAGRHRAGAVRVVAVLAAAWVACAVFAVHSAPGIPVAATSVADLVRDRAQQLRTDLYDQRLFDTQIAVDPLHSTQDDQLLAGLRGKDVLVTFVESYGRSAVQDPEFAPQVGAVLETEGRKLSAAGFAARSAYLTSSVTGSGSWLAHATFLSGVRIDNQQRYRTLMESHRETLSDAFRRAQWQTVAVMPGTNKAWPERQFYGYQRLHDVSSLGYHGPNFSWSSMPDQFTLAAFDRLERARPDRAPLMAEIDLTSSHLPWAPLPRILGWDEVGDGSVYRPMAAEGDQPEDVWRDPARVRTQYRRSIEYALTSLLSYVETHGDNNLVLIFLGDHQPLPIVTGPGAGRDVPITIVARDPAVLDRISGWGWSAGLNPGPQAPVWPMEAFRDRFLSAFGPPAAPARPAR